LLLYSENFNMNFLLTTIAIGVFFYFHFWLKRSSKRQSINIEKEVIEHFESKGLQIESIEDASNNRDSPFYGKLNLSPSTSGSGGFDLYKRRFFKVIISDESKTVKWIDCLYFINYKCYFIVKLKG